MKTIFNFLKRKPKQCSHKQYRWLHSDGTLMVYFKCSMCDFHDFGDVIGDPTNWVGETRV